MKRNPWGQTLARVIDELATSDDNRSRFRLKKPFPRLFDALASTGNAACVMPQRVPVPLPRQRTTPAA